MRQAQEQRQPRAAAEPRERERERGEKHKQQQAAAAAVAVHAPGLGYHAASPLFFVGGVCPQGPCRYLIAGQCFWYIKRTWILHKDPSRVHNLIPM